MTERILEMMKELEEIEKTTVGLDDEFYEALNTLQNLHIGMRDFDITEYNKAMKERDLETLNDQRGER